MLAATGLTSPARSTARANAKIAAFVSDFHPLRAMGGRACMSREHSVDH
jgi:hypothetical protein